MSIEIRSAWPRLLPLGYVSALIFCFGVLVMLFLFEPGRYGFYPQCLFHQVTGLLCPGCGSLRAVHQLLHGEVAAAFRLNAMLVVGIPAAGWFMAWRLVHVRNQKSKLLDVHPAWMWALLAIGILFGVTRNLSFAQALWLAP
jgi:hypothetical protein